MHTERHTLHTPLCTHIDTQITLTLKSHINTIHTSMATPLLYASFNVYPIFAFSIFVIAKWILCFMQVSLCMQVSIVMSANCAFAITIVITCIAVPLWSLTVLPNYILYNISHD